MMADIYGKLNVEIQPDGFTAKIIDPFSVWVDGHLITVAAGWVTDWASVPRFLWRLFPPMGKHTTAAVVHDYLYRFPKELSRKESDKVFLHLMKHSGVPLWQRTLMYWAVRLFGSSSWRG